MLLLIVESPNKATTLQRVLGEPYRVVSTHGGFMNLTSNNLGVRQDAEGTYSGAYEIDDDKVALLGSIATLRGEADEVIIATDPDREGEVIALHLVDYLSLEQHEYRRIYLYSLAKDAVLDALNMPVAPVDRQKAESGISRRLLDRLWGYMLSPMLRSHLQQCTSVDASSIKNMGIGRVSAFVLHLVADKQREIIGFVEHELSRYSAVFTTADGLEFDAYSIQTYDASDMQLIESKLNDAIAVNIHQVYNVQNRADEKETPPAPLNMIDLISGAWFLFGFNEKQTMNLAQQLFEKEYISYHRTDSRVLPEATIESVIALDSELFGQDIVESEPRVYKNSAHAQEGHHAIHPIYLQQEYSPESLSKNRVVRSESGFRGKQSFLSKDEHTLYSFIWIRTLASQLKAAIWDRSYALVRSTSIEWRIDANRLVDMGWREIMGPYIMKSLGKEQELSNYKEQDLSHLKPGWQLQLQSSHIATHHAKQPTRYSRGTLVQKMFSSGVGRPSTIHGFASSLIARHLIHEVSDESGRRMLEATELGLEVDNWVLDNIPLLTQVAFATEHEQQLNAIESGNGNADHYIDEVYSILKEVARYSDYTLPVLESTSKQKKVIHEIASKEGIVVGKSVEHAYDKAERFIAMHSKEEIKGLGPCPVCDGVIVEQPRLFGCSNYVNGCRFTVWKENTVNYFKRFERRIGEEELRTIVQNLLHGRGHRIDALTSQKSHRSFTAELRFQEYQAGKWSIGILPHEQLSNDENSEVCSNEADSAELRRHDLRTAEQFVDDLNRIAQSSEETFALIGTKHSDECFIKGFDAINAKFRIYQQHNGFAAITTRVTPHQMERVFGACEQIRCTNIAEHDTGELVLNRLRTIESTQAYVYIEEY